MNTLKNWLENIDLSIFQDVSRLSFKIFRIYLKKIEGHPTHWLLCVNLESFQVHVPHVQCEIINE